ncbi:MAG: Serine-protein kinase RsbW [Chlamydiae bacterium]|nr:Serine-protein kinase RsbW [Chlamydiota bacterium]
MEAGKYKIPEKLLRRIELACEETVINIASYAYQSKNGKIKIECSSTSEGFEVTIKDRGVPFDPNKAPVDLQTNKPVQERSVGGLGIHLIRSISDESSYSREGDENVFHLIFRIR